MRKEVKTGKQWCGPLLVTGIEIWRPCCGGLHMKVRKIFLSRYDPQIFYNLKPSSLSHDLQKNNLCLVRN